MTVFCVLFVVLVAGLTLPVVSCSEEQKADLPYGEVESWRPFFNGQMKDYRNKPVQNENENYEPPLYYLINVDTHVVNTGADGMLTFHARCLLTAKNDKNQQSHNITLNTNQRGDIIFQFWVERDSWLDWDYDDYEQAFKIQALNLGDIFD